MYLCLSFYLSSTVVLLFFVRVRSLLRLSTRLDTCNFYLLLPQTLSYGPALGTMLSTVQHFHYFYQRRVSRSTRCILRIFRCSRNILKRKLPATLTWTALAYGRNLLCLTRTNTGTELTLQPAEMMPVQSSRTERLQSRSLQSWCPLVTEMFNGVEAGTVVVNPLLYYQEEDNGV